MVGKHERRRRLRDKSSHAPSSGPTSRECEPAEPGMGLRVRSNSQSGAQTGAAVLASAAAPAAVAAELAERESGARAPSVVQQLYDGRTVKLLLAGGVAGCVSKTVTAPLARLTILFQVQSTNVVPGWNGTRQLGLQEAVALVVRREGFMALWKGNGVTVLHRLPYSGINFFAYEKLLFALSSGRTLRNRDDQSGTAVVHRLLAGGSAGCIACACTYPLDLVRTRLSTQTTVQVYSGVWGTISRIVRTEGFFGLYRGMGATLLGVGPSLAINFGVYETISAKWRRADNRSAAQVSPGVNPVAVSLGAGSVAGLVSATLCFPLDLVRRRLQMPGAMVPPGTSRVLHTARGVIQQDGMRGFYRGIVPELCKVVPGVGIAFGTYEYLKRWMHIDPL